MASLEDKIIEMTEFGALVETSDGSLTVRHNAHGQEFHSSEGAKFEAWQLYVVASGYFQALEQQATQPLTVLDVGMGLGYNAAATVAAWLESPGVMDVTMTSLESDDRLARAICGGKAPWQRGWSDSWLAGSRALNCLSKACAASIIHPGSGRRFQWDVKIGDAMSFNFGELSRALDFIWQDPFTPELNPTMWSKEWFAKLYQCSHSGTALVTYSVARAVKDALTHAGWHHERFATPGRKRHWLRAKI